LEEKCPRLEEYKQVSSKGPSWPLTSIYSLYINDTAQTPGVYLAFFTDDTCIYTTDRREGYVLRKLQRGFTSMESWCERWNIKINEDKAQVIYFSHPCGSVHVHLTLKGRNIPFVKNVKYLDVIFDRKITWGNTYRNDHLQVLSNLCQNLLRFEN
jgi:hypothetical protein